MHCPNDHSSLHPVKIPAKLGGLVAIDQCTDCGGLWFDGFELYRAEPGQDEPSDALDVDSLRSPSPMDHLPLHCPRDRSDLFRFEDSRFPQELVLMRCGECQGFWLNRGEFTRYQEALGNLPATQGMANGDPALNARVQELLAEHRANPTTDVLRKAGDFLSSPAIGGTRSSLAPAESEGTLGLAINVLVALLRIFVFRF